MRFRTETEMTERNRTPTLTNHQIAFKCAVVKKPCYDLLVQCCKWLYPTWRPSLTWVRFCCWTQETEHDLLYFIFIVHGFTCTTHSLGHYHSGWTPCSGRHKAVRYVRAHSEAHPRPSSVSQEMLTLLLHHQRVHPLIAISCFSRWSQQRLTSLTRPLSLTMLVRIG